MTTEMTRAILIEIIEMLEMINSTISDLAGDIVSEEKTDEEAAQEIEHWANLYFSTTKKLRDQKSQIIELERLNVELLRRLGGVKKEDEIDGL